MRKVLFIAVFTIVCVRAFAQHGKGQDVMARTYLLSYTVFGTKDSLVLEDLFARVATYGHSGGKVESREEAIAAITKNTSRYTDTSISNVNVFQEDDVAIVRYLFRARENKADGNIVDLNFTMMLVWIKEEGKWRLMGRQAVRLNQ